MGRQFDTEERAAITGGKIEFQEYSVALGAVAVIVNRQNSITQLRLGLLDSIFSGAITRWPVQKQNNNIDVAIGGINSSPNSTFRAVILKGKPFTLTATPFPSSEKLVEYVRGNPNAIGIVGLSWLRGKESEVQVLGLGQPGSRPDTTEPFGRYYPPVQAHIHRRYYPINAPVYIYRREVLPDVGYGFISYATSGAGQKLFLNNGLVPVTMPVRLVTLTSKGVQ
jgi:phosphate transport system substrate-binding protein